MKHWIIAVFMLVFGYFCWAEGKASVRFERLLDEHHDPKTNHVFAFEVWHDKESGQEFTCATSRDTNDTGGIDGKAYPLTCFPTGRNWK